MNIAIFLDCYYPRVNGVVVSVKSYSESLAKRGHKIIIVCPDYSKKQMREGPVYFKDEKEKPFPNIEIFRISSTTFIFSKEDRIGRLDQWHKLKKRMDDFKPDIVHINSEFIIGWFGATYARHRHIPTVFTFHTLWEEYFKCYVDIFPSFMLKKMGRDFVKFYLQRADEIICPTQRIGNVVQRYEVNRPYDILPTGIPQEISKFDKKYISVFFNHMHKLLPVIQKKHILLYAGRIVKEKNLPFLIDMLGEVRKKVNDAVLLFVGGGPAEEELKKYAKTKPYSWNICFAGYRSRDELSYFYNFADVFVFPSLTETQGLVTVEAMMCGLPVVAIGEMGTLDVMQGDNGGFMVHNDIKEFSDRVIDLLTDKQLYEQKKDDAIEWSKQWSLESLTPKLEECYCKAIENYKNKK